MRKHNRKGEFVFVIILAILLSPLIGYVNSAEDENPEPFFLISVLAPNTSSARNQWPTLMVEELPKIGIGIDVFDHTGWAQISPRTWGYPGPYPIPPYSDGGYDILFVGWSWDLDWEGYDLYTTDNITPNGDNFYQYSNPLMDIAAQNYNNSYNLADRINYCKEIQAILYEDLPQITILYPLEVYPYVNGFSGWNGLLWASDYQSMENWKISGETEFHYATPADFEDFYIHTYESVYDAQWLKQIYNGMVERDPALSNGYGSRLAESFNSSDGITYNVKLRNSAVWADGTPLTVDDVIYNYQLAITPDLGGTEYPTYIQYWDNDSITKINDYEMTIEFKQFYTYQDNNLALDLIPKHIWESIAPGNHQITAIDWVQNQPSKLFGAGPFKLKDYDSTNGIIHLEKNDYFDDWFGNAPKFDDVYFEFYGSKEGALAAIAAGEVDMVDAQFSPMLDELNIPGTTYELVEDPGVQEIAINMNHPYLGTGELCPIAGKESAKHIRKAISYLVPREYICAKYRYDLATPGITGCPNVAIGFDRSLKPYSYSINMALYHMAAAGFNIDYSSFSEPKNTLLIELTTPIIFMFFSLIGSTIIFNKKRKKFR